MVLAIPTAVAARSQREMIWHQVTPTPDMSRGLRAQCGRWIDDDSPAGSTPPQIAWSRPQSGEVCHQCRW